MWVFWNPVLSGYNQHEKHQRIQVFLKQEGRQVGSNVRQTKQIPMTVENVPARHGVQDDAPAESSSAFR